MEEGIGLLQQMGAAHALTTESDPNEAALTRSTKMQFVKGAPDQLKSAVTYATGNTSALKKALRDIGSCDPRAGSVVSERG